MAAIFGFLLAFATASRDFHHTTLKPECPKRIVLDSGHAPNKGSQFTLAIRMAGPLSDAIFQLRRQTSNGHMEPLNGVKYIRSSNPHFKGVNAFQGDLLEVVDEDGIMQLQFIADPAETEIVFTPCMAPVHQSLKVLTWMGSNLCSRFQVCQRRHEEELDTFCTDTTRE